MNSNPPVTLDRLNAASRAEFSALLDGTYEHSPWIAEQAAGPDRAELMIARRFFENTTDAERDLIAYWQMVKLVEEAHLRYTSGGPV